EKSSRTARRHPRPVIPTKEESVLVARRTCPAEDGFLTSFGMTVCLAARRPPSFVPTARLPDSVSRAIEGDARLSTVWRAVRRRTEAGRRGRAVRNGA